MAHLEQRSEVAGRGSALTPPAERHLRIAVRILVALAIPILAFGWLTSSVELYTPATFDPIASTGMFLVVGAVLALAGCASVTGRAWLTGRPVPLPALTVTVLLGLALVVERIRHNQHNDVSDVWPFVLFAWCGYFAGALALIMLVRALAGLWSMPELKLLPSRKTIVAVLLLAALVATQEANQPVYWF
jgi:hypothetical protein